MMAAEDRWTFIEARRLENAARAALMEFMPRLEDEGRDLEADFEDAVLCDDAELRDRCVEEAGRRGEGWRHLAWYEQLAERAREERDMRLLRSATRSIRLAAEREFHRREAGGADSRRP